MTIDSCKKWYSAFLKQGRTAEAEEMKKRIEAKGGNLLDKIAEEKEAQEEESEEPKEKKKAKK